MVREQVDRKPTLVDVAEAAGLSLGTVSKTLNGDMSVGADRRERVFAAIKALGYERNRIAASLRRQQSQTVGIVVPDIGNTFYSSLVEHLERLASDAGFTSMVVMTSEDPAKAASRIEVLRQQQVDGIFLVPSLDGSERIREALGEGMRCVIIDRVGEADAYPNVATDNADAARQGTRHLLSLGHRRILFAYSAPKLWNTRERIQGYEQAMHEAGLTPETLYVGMTVDDARRSLTAFLQRSDRPSALFTANNLVTMGAVGALQDVLLAVPAELSVLAFDDFEWLRLLRPAISAIEQPVEQLAIDAWEIFTADQGRPQADAVKVRAKAHLVIRQSTATPQTESET